MSPTRVKDTTMSGQHPTPRPAPSPPSGRHRIDGTGQAVHGWQTLNQNMHAQAHIINIPRCRGWSGNGMWLFCHISPCIHALVFIEQITKPRRPHLANFKLLSTTMSLFSSTDRDEPHERAGSVQPPSQIQFIIDGEPTAVRC